MCTDQISFFFVLLGRRRSSKTRWTDTLRKTWHTRWPDCAFQLPRKTDQVVFCPLTPRQIQAYKNILTIPDLKNMLRSNDPCECGSRKKCAPFLLEDVVVILLRLSTGRRTVVIHSSLAQSFAICLFWSSYQTTLDWFFLVCYAMIVRQLLSRFWPRFLSGPADTAEQVCDFEHPIYDQEHLWHLVFVDCREQEAFCFRLSWGSSPQIWCYYDGRTKLRKVGSTCWLWKYQLQRKAYSTYIDFTGPTEGMAERQNQQGSYFYQVGEAPRNAGLSFGYQRLHIYICSR